MKSGKEIFLNNVINNVNLLTDMSFLENLNTAEYISTIKSLVCMNKMPFVEADWHVNEIKTLAKMEGISESELKNKIFEIYKTGMETSMLLVQTADASVKDIYLGQAEMYQDTAMEYGKLERKIDFEKVKRLFPGKDLLQQSDKQYDIIEEPPKEMPSPYKTLTDTQLMRKIKKSDRKMKGCNFSF